MLKSLDDTHSTALTEVCLKLRYSIDLKSNLPWIAAGEPGRSLRS